MRHFLLLIIVLMPLITQAKSGVDVGALPESFDSLGPTVQNLTLENGRQVHFIDDGEPGWRPLVFTGGLGTSVRIIRLLDYLRSMRRALEIRVITVERNGFGQTEYDPELTMDDFAEEVEAVLDHLKIDKFAAFGISGGGPYTAKIASRNADRLITVHMGATRPSLGQPDRCTESSPASVYREMLRYPMQFFGYPADSLMHQIEGFQDTAYDEAARAHNLRGQQADVTPLDHEIALYCKEGVIDASNVKAPLFIYHGLADSILDGVTQETWSDAFPAADITFRTYPGEGHDAQYRHLDQILLDIAGHGDRVLVCRDNKNELVKSKDVASNDHLGLCAWSE